MNKEGQAVPQVTFRTRSGNDWKNVTSDEIFKGRTVVVFSLPGAFTPTCSSTHLPRYNELAPAFFANGVDAIVCVSVNDAFVMNEWAAGQECSNIQMLPDGNGEFTDVMGQLTTRRLAREEGIFTGISSGGALAAALKVSAMVEKAVIVSIVCDRGDRYLSTGVFPA